MAAGIKTAANAANNIIKNKTTLKSIATAAKNMGQNVLDGVAGNYKGYTKRIGQNIIKSNMSPAELKMAAKHGMDSIMSDPDNKDFIKSTIAGVLDLSKRGTINGMKANAFKAQASVKHASAFAKNTRMWGESAGDLLAGKALAKTDLGFRLGDAIGGGIRDSYRSFKAGHGVSNALKAGFTQKIDGVSKVRMDRVAGAAFGVGVAGRVATGGGLYRDRYGRMNVPGVPFI